jgi:hypothetical protein
LGSDGLEAKHANSRFPVVAPIAGQGNADGLSALELLVAPYGMIPASFKLFLEAVGSVDFIGAFSGWAGVENFPLLDPLQVFPVSELVSYHRYLISETGTLPKDDKGFYLQFAHEENAKEGISGSGLGYGIRIYPTSRMDGDLVNYGYTLGFVNYLRLAFKWCGFPNLEWFQREIDPRFLGLIERMRAGLVYV